MTDDAGRYGVHLEFYTIFTRAHHRRCQRLCLRTTRVERAGATRFGAKRQKEDETGAGGREAAWWKKSETSLAGRCPLLRFTFDQRARQLEQKLRHHELFISVHILCVEERERQKYLVRPGGKERKGRESHVGGVRPRRMRPDCVESVDESCSFCISLCLCFTGSHQRVVQRPASRAAILRASRGVAFGRRAFPTRRPNSLLSARRRPFISALPQLQPLSTRCIRARTAAVGARVSMSLQRYDSGVGVRRPRPPQ